MRVLLWHVDGPWTTAFVQGGHDYYVPVLPDRGRDGLGHAPSLLWPPNVRKIAPDAMRDLEIDVVVLQRPHECDLAAAWLGRRPGRDIPAVYVEHLTPWGDASATRHPMADQATVPVVHVTEFNELFWDCGSAPTTVVENGVLDPGYRYTGVLPHAATVVNDPLRRGRRVGADLVSELAAAVPVDVFGVRTDLLDGGLGLKAYGELPQPQMHRELARRRVYVHTARWTSLSRALVEAMLLGMPVVAVAATEVPCAVPAQAGVVTTNRTKLADAVRSMIAQPEWAEDAGRTARQHALGCYGLERFLYDWDVVLAEAV